MLAAADGQSLANGAPVGHLSFDTGGRLTSANWYGFVNYLFYDVNERWQTKARLEFFEDSKGIRTGTAGLYTALTLGATWKPTPWLWVLPEVRYDHASRGRPFEGNQDMFTATIGGLLRW